MKQTSRTIPTLVIAALAVACGPFMTPISTGSAMAQNTSSAKSWNDPDFPGVDPTQRALYGCTFSLKRFRMKYKQVKYSAFAKGRAFSITGMRGCGWSVGERTQARADKVAMDKCRKNARNPDRCEVTERTTDR